MTDWQSWHADYDDASSPLTARLRVVQGHIDRWLDEHPDREVQVVSMCAGQGRDILEVLARRPDAGRVRADLVELDPGNAELAAQTARAAGLDRVAVRREDAGVLDTYTARADLFLACGVFGNITDDEIHHTVASLPALCEPGATVIWTRTRRAPDATPAIREWFAAAGFEEVAFEGPPGPQWSVGVHRLIVPPRDQASGRMFWFSDAGTAPPGG